MELALQADFAAEYSAENKFTMLNDKAQEYSKRRTTPAMTQAECDALRKENDIDPTGEYGLRILDRHLLAIDRVKELCRKNPNKPKVKEAILAEYRSFEADAQAIAKEAHEKWEQASGRG